MGAELESGPSEYLVARAETRHGLTHRLDCSGELHPQYGYLLWPPKAVDESYEEWIGFSEPPVRRANCRRMDTNQNFVVFGSGLCDVLNLNHLRRPVSAIDGGFQNPTHSSRSSVKGSSDNARCAGIQVATSPSNNIATTTPANTSGSRGVA